jgi:hypothetical protein
LQALFKSAQQIYEKREGSGSVPLTNGSGSGRPKTHADPADPDPVPDPDPQHCCKAYDKNMEELARTVLASHLAAKTGTSGSPPSFCVFFKTRNNNQVGRDDVVKLMASGTLMDGWHFLLVYCEENILLVTF